MKLSRIKEFLRRYVINVNILVIVGIVGILVSITLAILNEPLLKSTMPKGINLDSESVIELKRQIESLKLEVSQNEKGSVIDDCREVPNETPRRMCINGCLDIPDSDVRTQCKDGCSDIPDDISPRQACLNNN